MKSVQENIKILSVLLERQRKEMDCMQDRHTDEIEKLKKEFEEDFKNGNNKNSD